METKLRTSVVKNARRIVVKVGSGVICDERGVFASAVCERLAREITDQRAAGREVVLVSSGAVALGRESLKLAGDVASIPDAQAVSAIGQSRLIHAWESAFTANGQLCAQVLLTHDDLENRRRYLNARNTLTKLLDYNVIPVVNENDSVVVEEIKLGDNDNLAAMVTPLVDADLLILLTNTDAVYDADPRTNNGARPVPYLDHISEDLAAATCGAPGLLSRGGMASKLRAAQRAARYGVPTIIASGCEEGVLPAILDGEQVGTLFAPHEDRLSARKHWIAYTLRVNGSVTVDAGAAKALLAGGRSLLPGGITGCEGAFDVGEAVAVLDAGGNEIARGIAAYGAADVAKIAGAQSGDIRALLGYKYTDEVIHRDNLVLMQTAAG